MTVTLDSMKDILIMIDTFIKGAVYGIFKNTRVYGRS